MTERRDAYQNRDQYRALHRAGDLVYFRVTQAQTDLHIGAKRDLSSLARSVVAVARLQVETQLKIRPRFGTALEPLSIHGSEPPLILDMLRAGQAAGVGPMAAVAGAIAQEVGRRLKKDSPEGIVENGGDLFLWGSKTRTVAIFAGASPLSGKLGVQVTPGDGLGVCTSSGTVGHSLSYGRADAALVIAQNAALADAAATRLWNLCTGTETLTAAVEQASAIPGVLGTLAILGESLAALGQVELTALDKAL